jgi:hypothetical protein
MRVEKEEIWLGIKDYEGLYEVSSFGRVKSLDRYAARGGGGLKFLRSRVLKTSICRGYLTVKLSILGATATKQVHQLVAIAFLNHIPCKFKIVIDHKDNNKLNNYKSNLQLISNRENSSKDKKGGTSKFVGVRWHKFAKKWEAQIRIGSKTEYLGTFTDELTASEAYQTRLAEHLASSSN